MQMMCRSKIQQKKHENIILAVLLLPVIERIIDIIIIPKISSSNLEEQKCGYITFQEYKSPSNINCSVAKFCFFCIKLV